MRHYVHSSPALLFTKPLILWPVLKMDPAKIGQKLFKFSTLKFKTAALNILRSRDIWLGQSFHRTKHKTLSQACADSEYSMKIILSPKNFFLKKDFQNDNYKTREL